MDRADPRVQLARDHDLDTVSRTIELAFVDDPLWSWALARRDGRTEHQRLFWRLFVEGALRYDATWVADEGAAASVWIPPGGTDLSSDQEEQLDALVVTHLGDRGDRFRELLSRFEDHHPRDEPHYYLSLLGTHPDARGRGVGMALLTLNLAVVDAEHAPAYLESSNPANDVRYRSVGFEPVGSYFAPDDGPEVTTMWRRAR
ncbi:MAG: GNAT family N-acetyltransferase [Acidimicrobiales bacterium]